VDLSPRQAVPVAPRSTRRKWLPMAVLALVLVAGGVMVAKFLTSAIDYYCNVDEVGVKDGCDVGRSIRIQGVVEKDSVAVDGAVTNFVVAFNGVAMPVRLGSKPTGLFQECIPVVVRGKVIEDDTGARMFEGDEVIVKHDNEYDAENSDRLNESNAEAAACSRKG